jgi:uncharacterized protein YbaR (Trm112 family)
MICPACRTGIRFEPENKGPIHRDPNEGDQTGFQVVEGFCPECRAFLVVLRRGQYWQHDLDGGDAAREFTDTTDDIIFPASKRARPLPSEVPEPYRSDFAEAYEVLTISTKASAAISRRLLQQLLRDELKIVQRNLDQEIAEFIGQSGVPSHLAGAVDAIRTVGNFAAHPTKNTNTGEILEVEPSEAQWLIDVIESLFDFVFVQPKQLAAKRTALNQKLAAAGKPPIK